MTQDHWVFVACLVAAALSGIGLRLLADPHSRFSRLVDRERPTR